MSRKSEKQSLINTALMQGLILAVAAAVFWWFRRRASQRQSSEQQPVIWRRDIEMGPSGGGEQPAAGPVEEVLTEEVVIEAIPDVRAGDGGLSDEGTGENETEENPGSIAVETRGEEVPVEGPVPDEENLPEDQTPGGDDLELIEGIGPKINTILQEAGIRTFTQLAGTEVARLEEILRSAGLGRISNPGTWPEQARFAAAADWSGLENLQKTLKAGRR